MEDFSPRKPKVSILRLLPPFSKMREDIDLLEYIKDPAKIDVPRKERKEENIGIYQAKAGIECFGK